jgi:hypothetical protein
MVVFSQKGGNEEMKLVSLIPRSLFLFGIMTALVPVGVHAKGQPTVLKTVVISSTDQQQRLLRSAHCVSDQQHPELRDGSPVCVDNKH